jgi:hypothetical protein
VHALLRHRPFPRHCEQVAVAAALQFLSLNGWRADLNPPAPAVVVIEALASGRLTPEAASAWLSPRLTPTRPPLRVARLRPPLTRARPASARVSPASTRTRRVLTRARPNFTPARPVLTRTRPVLTRAWPNFTPARPALTGARPNRAGRASQVRPASRPPLRRAVASVLLALTVGSVSLLAAACSRGPTAPATPSRPVPASTAPGSIRPASTVPANTAPARP